MFPFRIPSAVAVAATLIGTLQAATFHVDFKAEGSNDGSNWSNAFTTLQAALNVAGATDTVKIAEGPYFPDEGPGQTNNDPNSTFLIPNKVILIGGYPSGGGTTPNPFDFKTILSGDLDQDDNDPDNNDIIDSKNDRSGLNAYHVVRVAQATQVSISGVVITAGFANGTGTDDLGGGVLVESTGELSLDRCRLSGNDAAGEGGGVSTTKAILEFTDCLFTGNSSDGFGGALFSEDGMSDLTNCAFLGNAAVTGGAIFINTEAADYRNLSFSGNAAGNGGGAIFANSNSTIEFRNTLVWNNEEDGNIGNGASSLVLDGGSTASFSYSLFHGWDLSGSPGSSDGTSSGAGPDFHLQPDPGDAPDSIGDLRLLPGSNQIDKGLNSNNSTTTDLAGETRKISDIDLGAYEFQRALFVDDTATGSNHGGSWENAFTDLQTALDEVSSGWTIHVARGLYYPDEGPGQTPGALASTFELISNVTLLGGYPNGGNGSRNPASQRTILSGDLGQDDYDPDGDGIIGGLVDFNGTNARHVLTGSNVTASAVIDGFYVNAGNATGGIVIHNMGGGLIIESGSPTIRDCRFIGNRSFQYGGAVIISDATSSPVFRNCEFTSNQVSGSGSPPQGGAIYCNFDTTPDFISCEFRGNESYFHGGAISMNSATVDFENCLFSGNRTLEIGGAIIGFDSTMNFVGCTFSANRAGDPAGGGALYSANSHVDLENTVMWNNAVGGSIGGFDSSYSFNINIGSTATDDFDNCLVQGRNLTNTGSGNLNGVLTANNPLFLINATALGNPHVCGDFHLGSGSPLGAQGNNTYANEVSDLDGETRIQGGTIEIGAYEGLDTDPDFDDDGLPNWWEQAHTSPSSTTSLSSTSDDDNDGIEALYEFAHGLDPNEPDGSGSARWWTLVNASGIDFPGLTFKRGSGVSPYVKFVVEHSLDLGDNDAWDAGAVVLAYQNGNEFVYRGKLSIPNEDHQFLRVRVMKVEP